MDGNGQPAGFSCFFCSEFVPGSYSSLTKHFRTKHLFKTSNSSRNNLVCGQNGCKEKFETFANFKYHLSVCEKVTGRIAPGPPVPDPVSENAFPPLPPPNVTPIDCEYTSTVDNDIPETPDLERNFDVTRHVAAMTLKLRSHYNVSHSALDFMLTELKSILYVASRVIPVDRQTLDFITSLGKLDITIGYSILRR